MTNYDETMLQYIYESINMDQSGLTNDIPKTPELYVDISNVLFHHGSSAKLSTLTSHGSKQSNLYGPAIYLAANAYDGNKGYGTYKYYVTLHPSDKILNGDYKATKQELYDIFQNATGRFAKWLSEELSQYSYPNGVKLKFLLREAVYKGKNDLRTCGCDGIVDYGMEVAIFNDKLIKSITPIS